MPTPHFIVENVGPGGSFVPAPGGMLGIQAAQVVAVGAASATSAAVQSTTNCVVLTPTVDCWVTLGAAPTAAANTTGSIFLPAGVPSYPIAVTGSTTKIAVIQNASAGYLSITESN